LDAAWSGEGVALVEEFPFARQWLAQHLPCFALAYDAVASTT
jgi:hypothetical protein